MAGRIDTALQRPELTGYAGRCCLLIGGAGFIGSHLADQLHALGARIVVLDDLRNGARDNLADVDCELVVQAIEDTDLPALLADHGVDHVFHLACGSLAQSLTDAPGDFAANAVNAVSSLEAFRAYGRGRGFVLCSTGSVYGEPDSRGYTEQTPFRPSTPYGTSKACGDLYAQLYASFFGLPVRIVRYNNIYGPRKRGTAVPTFVERALRGEGVVIEGGQQVRTPTFVLDAVEATLLVGLCDGIDGEAFNVSAATSCTIEEMVRWVWRVVNGADAEPEIEWRDYRPGEIMVLQPSVDKIRQRLDWQAAHDFEAGLAILVAHLRAEQAGAATSAT